MNGDGVVFGFGVAFGAVFETGVVPVAGVFTVTGVVFAIGAVFDFDEPFFGATGVETCGRFFLGFGVGLTLETLVVAPAIDGEGEGAREW